MKENRSYLPRESHLPLYGVGPVYVAVIITVTMEWERHCGFWLFSGQR